MLIFLQWQMTDYTLSHRPHHLSLQVVLGLGQWWRAGEPSCNCFKIFTVSQLGTAQTTGGETAISMYCYLCIFVEGKT